MGIPQKWKGFIWLYFLYFCKTGKIQKNDKSRTPRPPIIVVLAIGRGPLT